jgi:hypothetical protein
MSPFSCARATIGTSERTVSDKLMVLYIVLL